jgi:hypothetical protein
MTAPVVLSLLDQPDNHPQRSVELTLPVPDGWPPPPAHAAYHGLAGEIVNRIAPHTEADPVAILSQLLVAFGAAAGRGAWFQVEATHHHPNEFLVLIGDSARSRKGSSWDHVHRLMNRPGLLGDFWLWKPGGVDAHGTYSWQAEDAAVFA